MKTPRVVFYLRVSTVAQDFAAQKHAMAEYCKRRDWRPLKLYQEKRPGANASRTQLDYLLRDARRGEFDVVLIYKLDRLGRSCVHLAQIVEELAGLKIGLISLNEGIDTTDENPMSRALIQIIGALAELDRQRIRERSADGLKAARARGVRLGRPPLEPGIEDRIRELRAKRDEFRRPLPYREIAAELGISIGTVSAVLKRSKSTSPEK